MPLKERTIVSLILTSIWIDLLIVSNDPILAAKYLLFSSVLVGIFCQYLCDEGLQMCLLTPTEPN